jgi:hypothetical protein
MEKSQALLLAVDIAEAEYFLFLAGLIIFCSKGCTSFIDAACITFCGFIIQVKLFFQNCQIILKQWQPFLYFPFLLRQTKPS